jgi:hypothetical protein
MREPGRVPLEIVRGELNMVFDSISKAVRGQAQACNVCGQVSQMKDTNVCKTCWPKHLAMSDLYSCDLDHDLGLPPKAGPFGEE